MARRLPAPCSGPSATTSKPVTSFWRSSGRRIADPAYVDSIPHLATDGISLSGVPLFRCPRPAHPCPVAASPVIAPPLGSGFCGIVKNPAAVRIGADPHALRFLSHEGLRQGSGDLRKCPVPIAPHRNQLCPPPILALDEPLPHQYVESMIQFGDFSGAKRASRGQHLRGAPKKVPQVHQCKARRFTRRNRRELPMSQERRQPLRVVQLIRAFAESVRVKDVSRRFHGNGLNPVDSLQRIGYPHVMSIAVIGHYSNRGPLQGSPVAAAAHG